MNFKPQSAMVEAVKIVSIDSLENGRKIEPDDSPSKISVRSLNDQLKILTMMQYKRLVLLAFENTVDFTDPEFPDLIQTVHKDPRIFWSTLTLHKKIPNTVNLPETLKQIENQLAPMDMFRDRSLSIVRTFPLYGFQNLQKTPMFALKLDQTLEAEPLRPENGIYFSFIEADRFTVSDIRELTVDVDKGRKAVNDKILVVSSLKYREWPTTTYEPNMVNTPLKNDVNNVIQNGEKMAVVIANLIENVIYKNYLRQVGDFWRIPQIIFLTVIGVFFFFWPVALSLIVYCLSWVGVLLLHGILFAAANVYIPLSGEFIFFTLALLVGIWTRSDQNARHLFAGYLSLQGKRSQFAVENSFFKDFAQNLGLLNVQASALSEKLRQSDGDPENIEVYTMLKEVQSDFEEYLQGVKQVSNVNEDLSQSVSLVSTNVLEILTKVKRRFSVFTGKNKIEIKVDPSCDLKITTDAGMLDAVLHNLVSNAVKYSPLDSEVYIKAFAAKNNDETRKKLSSEVDASLLQESRMTLKSPRDALGQFNSSGCVVILVCDRGPGIPADKQELIFEKFYRVKNDGVYSVKGTGLGLYLCRYFAKSINARVNYYPRSGGGSVFSLELDQ